jgi:hypothetical protein
MGGITFNIIIIRVYQDRLRLTDSNADTGDAHRDKMLSGLRLRTAHSTTNGTVPENQVNEEHHAEKDDHARGN